MDFKHNVAKHYSFADNVPTILGRYSDFSQAIMNVVRNALDAMYECETREISVRTEVQNDEIRVTVRDMGCGIASADKEKIFLPFYTTKPVVGHGREHEPTGTGLGLTTVQKLLSPYGVRFEIDSTIGAGTTFSICVPISANSPQTAGPTPEELSPSQ